jgi:peroxiredoxin family protein
VKAGPQRRAGRSLYLKTEPVRRRSDRPHRQPFSKNPIDKFRYELKEISIMTATKPKETAAFICSRDTLDGAYPPLILAINAARAGMETKVFFTFMGINLACKGGIEKARFIPPGVMGAVPGMSAIATGMMKKKIDKAQIPTLPELMEIAQLEGVELIVCKMTIDMMELNEDQLVEGSIVWTAEDFIKYAKDCKICMFI